MFERLIEQIEGHVSYAPAMREAVARGGDLYVDYHTHGEGMPYCISIGERPHGMLPVLGQVLPNNELVHVNGFGQSEDQCRTLCEPLVAELVAHYGLQRPPEILLNGQALPTPDRN